MTTKTITTLLASCLLSFAACSGGDTGSGVDGAKTFNNVTAEEAVQICEYEQSRIPDADLKKLGCYYGAITQSETEEACQIIFDACIAEPNTDPVVDECADAGSDLDTLPECASMVTVGEIADCSSASQAAITTLVNSIDCSTPAEDLTEPAQPAQCAAIDEKCPGLLGG
jgi:hypothetical protein